MSCPDCEGVGGHDCAAYGQRTPDEKLIRMAELTTGHGYMPQVQQDGAWTDLFTMCVDRLLTARVVTTAVRGKRTRIVERHVWDRVVES